MFGQLEHYGLVTGRCTMIILQYYNLFASLEQGIHKGDIASGSLLESIQVPFNCTVLYSSLSDKEVSGSRRKTKTSINESNQASI